MSNALARLREVFGDALLTRTRAGPVPTPCAQALKPRLRVALALFDDEYVCILRRGHRAVRRPLTLDALPQVHCQIIWDAAGRWTMHSGACTDPGAWS